MLREVIIKLAGATLLLLGIGLLVIGFLMANKFMQATGFMSGIVALVLLYYNWMVARSRPIEEEPENIAPLAKQ
jgi:membrane protein implicated in regulation of membrane protease activity